MVLGVCKGHISWPGVLVSPPTDVLLAKDRFTVKINYFHLRLTKTELQAGIRTHIQDNTEDLPRPAHSLAIEYSTLTTSYTTEWTWKLQQVAHSLESVLGHIPSLHRGKRRLFDRVGQL